DGSCGEHDISSTVEASRLHLAGMSFQRITCGPAICGVMATERTSKPAVAGKFEPRHIYDAARNMFCMHTNTRVRWRCRLGPGIVVAWCPGRCQRKSLSAARGGDLPRKRCRRRVLDSCVCWLAFRSMDGNNATSEWRGR